MAKQSGIGWTTLSVDDSGGTPVDLRNDITNFQLATPRGVQDVTGLDKSAMERLVLLADASITLNGVFNPSASKSHQTLRTVTTGQNLRTTSIGIASQTLAMEMLYTDYNLNRAQDGSFVWSSPGVLADGTVPTWGP
jgi:hypothetical protein